MSRAQLVAGVPFALAIARFTSAKLRRAHPHPHALERLTVSPGKFARLP